MRPETDIGAQSALKWGYHGVSWDKARSRWRASIAIRGKKLHLGYARHAAEAAAMYDVAARDRGLALNFPVGDILPWRCNVVYR